MSILKEAIQTAEQVLADLDQAKAVYNLRNEELHDETLWGAMSRSVKMKYFEILKNKEAEIARLERKLERTLAGQPEVDTEPTMAEGIVGDVMPETKPEEMDIEKEIIADLIPDASIPTEENKQTDKILLRRQIETIINSVEDLILNNTGLDVSIVGGLQEILSKFKEIRGSVDGENDIDTTEIKVIKLDDVNSDSNEEDKTILKGDLEEVSETDPLFVDTEVYEILKNNYHILAQEPGLSIIQNKNLEVFTVEYGDNHLEVKEDLESDNEQEMISAKAEATKVRDEIIYQLKLNK